MQNNYLLVLVTSVLNYMFFVSGLDKLFHYSKVVNGLHNRLGSLMPFTVYKILIVVAILIELICPMVIFYSSLVRNKKNDRYAMFASVVLIVFTVFATLFYHFPPTTSAKYYPFMSNLSLVGGLCLMTLVFYRNALL